VEKTFRGEGPEHSSFFSLDSYLTLMSHAFEYYQNAPRKGYLVDLNWSTRQRGLGSSIGLNRYLLTAKYLMNWGGFDPPLFVLGFRFQYGLLDISQLDDAPVSSRFFLGGDDNLRGFPRKSLNNQGLGYSSYIYLGTEARMLKVLPFGLQPFLLYDIAKVALENNTFIEPILTSAGAGMRWQSPFGSFRATLAYGMIDNHDQYALGPTNQWKAFFSFGKEF
jgi:translocation and assembly module TamA